MKTILKHILLTSLATIALFVLASFIFAKPVFATWGAEGSCDFAGFTTVSGSKTFPDEASCRTYVAQGDGICRKKANDAGYGFLSYTTFTLTKNCYQIGCGAGQWSLRDKCVTKDQWCVGTYGPDIHEAGDQCVCDAGFNFVDNRCITQDEACQSKYGANIHGDGDQCVCDDGFSFLNNQCVTKDKACQTKYDANIHEEGGQCICNTGYSFFNDACVPMDQYCHTVYGDNAYPRGDSCYCTTGYVFNEKNICVPQPISPQPIDNTDKKYPPPTNDNQKKKGKDANAAALDWFKSKGYGPEKLQNITDAQIGALVTALLYERIFKQITSAQAKFDKADQALSRAFANGSTEDPATLETIRRMFLDSWLDDPQNQKTSMMMAMLERKKGNDSTADVYEKLAYANLNTSERTTLSSKNQDAQRSFRDKLVEKEAAQTQLERELRESSFTNRMKNEISDAITSAQESAKEICYRTKPCDWAYAKKIEIMTKASNLSQEISDLMNDPIKTTFGIDRKKVKERLGIQKSKNGEQ